MSLSDPEVLELNTLCNALVDGVIRDADKARLEQMLRTSEDARRFYVRSLALSSSLMQYAGEMQAEAPDIPTVPIAHRSLGGMDLVARIAGGGRGCCVRFLARLDERARACEDG
ncbi:MAG: hypothetical protein WDN28_26060 [Chthoniobacter sp.]